MFQAILRYAAFLLAVMAGGMAMAGASEKRVALVIGNSAYRHAAELDNPRNDAADIGAAMEKLGFQVIRGLDLDKSRMDQTLRHFAEALKGASIGAFFYAGHGLQVSGKNYLVPIDAKLTTAEALDFEMVGLDVVQRIMEAATETNILFVDACRDNPLSRNLARAMGTRSAAIGHGLTAQEAGAGTLISFSTQPGNVASDGTGTRNSPYAGALIRHIATPSKDLSAILVQVRREVMANTGKAQIPWEHSALTSDVIFAPGAGGAAAADGAPKAGAHPAAPIAGRDDAGTGAAARIENNRPSGGDASAKTGGRTVVKVGNPNGTITIVNSVSPEFLFNENGRKLLVDKNNASGALPVNAAVELPAGRYLLKGESGLVTVKRIELGEGQNIVLDLRHHVGSLRVLNAKEEQHIYTESGRKIWIEQKPGGKFSMGAIPNDKVVQLPPGNYYLKSGNPLSATQPVRISLGEETVIDFGG